MRNEIMKFNLTSVYIVISRSKIDVNQLQIVIITANVFSKEVVNDGGSAVANSSSARLPRSFLAEEASRSIPISRLASSTFLQYFFNKSSTLYDIRNSFLSLSTEWGRKEQMMFMEMSQYVRRDNVMSCSAMLCYVCSDGRSLMSRRCFSDTVWRFHRAGDSGDEMSSCDVQ